MLYETNYKKLLKLIPDLETIRFGATRKLKAEGFMDLNIDVLERSGNHLTLALSHYYKHPSGDMIPDPDMEVRIDLEKQTAEALSYQDGYGYQMVYPEPDKVNVRTKKELNQFLKLWLSNLISQGHK